MSNEVSKILDDEKSVKAPLMKSMISDSVQTELRNMRNQVKNYQQKIDKANLKLTDLRQQQQSSKGKAVYKSLKTKANPVQHRSPTSSTTSNRNEKVSYQTQSSSTEMRQRHRNENLNSNPNSTSKPKSSLNPRPSYTSNSRRNETNPNPPIVIPYCGTEREETIPKYLAAHQPKEKKT